MRRLGRDGTPRQPDRLPRDGLQHRRRRRRRGPRQGRRSDPAGGPGRGRAPGGLGQHRASGRRTGLGVRVAPDADPVAAPALRSAAGRPGSGVRRGSVGRRRGHRERPPAGRAVRPRAGPSGCERVGGRGPRAQDPSAPHRTDARVVDATDRRRCAGHPGRRLQRTLPPRLDRRDGRRAATHATLHRLAGQPRHRGGWLPRCLAGRSIPTRWRIPV